MTRRRWQSQPFPPDGASAAEGIRNQLGRPELDLLTILVREAAQNSWDARSQDARTVRFDIATWLVGAGHMHAWRDTLLAGAPFGADFPLRQRLQPGETPLRVLQVSDRGTDGLAGPTRANVLDGGPRDFITFIRNVGEPRDTPLGGGTYGFGKGIFYLLAKQGAILVYTRCRTSDGSLESRLIGCALWKSFVGRDPHTREEHRYTGRHWWGDVADDGVVEPLLGDEADSVAARLGIRGFADDETGTTIVVIDPILEDLSPSELGDYLAETMVWHLWPKMLDGGGDGAAMDFAVHCDGVDHAVPDPRRFRPVDMFVQAYETMTGNAATTLACQNPKKDLGAFAVRKRLMPRIEATRAGTVVDVEDSLHHVCLMRPAELVVTYLKGPKPPSENYGYAGVFRAFEDMDDVYAKAEPPTHDAWHASMLERPESTYVNTTFTRINEQLAGLFELTPGSNGSSSAFSLGAASTAFGALLPGGWGTGGATVAASPNPRRKKQPSSAGDGHEPDIDHEAKKTQAPTRRDRSHARVQLIDEPQLRVRDGGAVLVQQFALTPGVRMRIDAAVVVGLPGAAREKDPPINAQMPTVLYWRTPTGETLAPGAVDVVGLEGVWELVAQPAADTVTEINISATKVVIDG